MQVVAAGDGEAEGLQELGGLGLLEDVAAGAGAQRLAGVLGVLAHREDRDGERGVRDEALWQRGEARAPGHREVERQQVGLVGADFADRGGHVGGLGDDAELVGFALEDGADAVADDGVVVCDDDVDRAVDPGGACLHGAHRSERGSGSALRESSTVPRARVDFSTGSKY